MSRVDVLGVGFNNLDMGEAVLHALELIDKREGKYVVTPNPEIVMLARADEQLASAIEAAAMVLADGIGVVKGASILGRPLRGRVPGIDFATNLLGELAKRGGSVYLFGAKPGVAALAAEKMAAQFKGLRIAGVSDGYFTDDLEIKASIRGSDADFLMVCLGSPKQEKWMRENEGSLNVGLMAGLGGSLDVFSGTVERAPIRWQKLGLEWLYRLMKEPKRIGRMMNLPLFVIEAIKHRIRG